MELVIFESSANAAEWVAARIADRIARFKPSPEKSHWVLGLPTGSTPLPVYALWADWVLRGRLSFRWVVTFNMDEYCGLGPDHTESYAHFMEKELFSKVDLPRAQTHLLDGLSEDLACTCREYEFELKRWGGLDLQLCGVGEGGHLAFNEAFSSFGSPTRRVKLTEQTRRVNARFFEGSAEAVPSHALTIGLQALSSARELLVLATGPRKAKAVAQAVEGPLTHGCPLSLIQLHPSALVVCDAEAASGLQPETRYYLAGSAR